MDRLLLGVTDDNMREKMIGIPHLTLSKAIDICKAVEAASVHMKALKEDEIVYKLSGKSSANKSSRSSKLPGQNKAKQTTPEMRK